MARQASEAKRAERLAQRREEMLTRRDELRKITEDCHDDRCACHWREWRELKTLRALLTGREWPDE